MNASKTNLRYKVKNNINSLLADALINKDPIFVNELTALLHDLDNNEYRITILGEFSSGKSTFLNALIGQDILPHGVEETTAAVTYIHNVSDSNPKKNKVEVFFRDDHKQKVVLDLNKSKSALIDYVTTKAKGKDVVNDIESVHIYIPFVGSDEKLVLIDTPGLNGVKDGMRDITYQEIYRSHANICLFNIKGASQSDLDFIENFYKNGTPFFFVLNQIDNLKDDEETPEQKIKDFTQSIKENILHISSQPSNVFGISALQALTARDKRIQRLYSDSALLTIGDRVELLKKSRIESFETALYDFVKNGEIERNYINQVNARLKSILTITAGSAKEELELLKAKVTNIPEKEFLTKQEEQVEKRFDENKKIIRNKLGSQMDDLEKMAKSKVWRICENITDEAKRIVNGWNDLETAEIEARQGRVAKYINDNLAERREELTLWFTPRFDEIYNRMIDVVRSFVPSVKFSKKDAKWKFSYDKEKVTDESKLDSIKRDISEIEKEIEIATQKKQELNNQKQILQIKIKEKQKEITQNERDRMWEYSNLGSRPSYRTWQKKKTVKKKFLGLISYNSDEYYEHDNQEEINRWDRRKNEIDRKYNQIENSLRAAKANYEREKRNSDSGVYDSIIRQLGNQLNALNLRRQQEEAEIAVQRKLARTTRLKNLKARTYKFIETSISPDNGTLYIALKDDAETIINGAEEKMTKELELSYQNLTDIFKSNVRLLIRKIENKIDIVTVNKRIEYLTKLIICIDNYKGKFKN